MSDSIPHEGDVMALPSSDELEAVWQVVLVQVHEALGVAVAVLEHVLDRDRALQAVYPLPR